MHRRLSTRFQSTLKLSVVSLFVQTKHTLLLHSVKMVGTTNTHPEHISVWKPTLTDDTCESINVSSKRC